MSSILRIDEFGGFFNDVADQKLYGRSSPGASSSGAAFVPLMRQL